MPKAGIETRIDDRAWRKADTLLAYLPLELREKTLKRGVRLAARVVSRATRPTITKPGYPGDIPGKPALADSITEKISTGSNYVAGFVGADYNLAPHFHLYDQDHVKVLWGVRTGGIVHGADQFKVAADTTKPAQARALIDTLKRAIRKLKN